MAEGSHCADCNKILVKLKVIPEKGHNFTIKINKASLWANGLEYCICYNCGEEEISSTIYAPKTLTLSVTSFTYTGKQLKPTVTVKDSKGKIIAKSNYNVSYYKNIKAGTATVKITFKGDYYTGTMSKTFTITKAKNSITGTATYSKTAANNASKGKITVSWSKLSYVTGYEIQYSTSSSFASGKKTVNISGASNVSKVISGLTKNKTYYVRIRTYKTIAGKKVYSAWSAKKSVKIGK